MLKYLFIPILTQTLVSRAYGFELPINTNLSNGEVLKRENWASVSVIQNCSFGEDVTIRVQIPLSLNPNATDDDISVFFANDEKEILRTTLKCSIRGSFFSVPYKMEKTMEGPEVHPNAEKDSLSLEGHFPKAWLPKNCTKISASIQSADGKIYNYYGIRNFNISIPDLMVTEEYKEYKCDS